MRVKLIKTPTVLSDGQLQFGESYVFEIEASTKVLLEMTRHRDASYACRSSRYTLNRSEIIFEQSEDEEINRELQKLQQIIEKFTKTKKNDDLSLLLPQAYQYKWLARFSPSSLDNFFTLRCAKSAHYHIREVAIEMWNSLPTDHLQFFKTEKCK